MTASITRRKLLIGGGVAVGLLIAFELWPRRYTVRMALDKGETGFGPFLKIGEDGRVTVIVPQAETGQGAWTALSQIPADELGADGRTVAVEPATIGPLYVNHLLAHELSEDLWLGALAGIGDVLAERWATDQPLMMTALSTSVRSFEAPLRAAGATARALLCMAAGERWDADWRACDTATGFVVRGNDRLRFGELAARAATFAPPKTPPVRRIGAGNILEQSVPRHDAPSKLDESIRFAGDVRLQDIVFVSVRQAPPGDSRLVRINKAAAYSIPDLIAVIDNPGWVAAAAENWRAANRALDALAARFATHVDPPGGLLFASPAAISPAIGMTAGLSDARRMSALGLPHLFGAPEIRVELISSGAKPGGVSGLAVPPVASATGNALATAIGHRSRSLPLSIAA